MKNPEVDSLSAEQNLILATLRFFCMPESLARQRIDTLLQKKEMDWDQMLATAKRHRVSAFLTYAFKKAQLFERLPTSIQGFLKSAMVQATVENMAKMAEFKKYSSLFEEQNIPIIPLKGIALTHVIYEEMPVRRMGDIDIFVREGDLERVKTLLKSHGFCQRAYANLWHTAIASRLIGRESYVKNGLDIDVQWHPRFYICGDYVVWNTEQAWRYSQPCPLLGTTVHLFLPLQQGQYLLLQIANDFNSAGFLLVQLFDLAMVIKKFNLDKDKLFQGVSGELKPNVSRQIEELLQAVLETFLNPHAAQIFSIDTLKILQAAFESGTSAQNTWGGTSIIRAPLSRQDKVAFFFGYFSPDPNYIRQQYGHGFLAMLRGLVGHWIRLMSKALRFLSGGLGR